MNNSKSVAELINNVNAAYLSDADVRIAVARAERAEFIVASFASAGKAIKSAIAKIKSNLVTSSAQHA
ncbi:RSP_7527 family protein [Marinomonas posidonica]|uniref:Uncharacterized protein n=1 Tax=Marinomonas posidonica (strain CECT 7376 / NCIMB 14433 / IVIA-Po-181) TaxID=491952 RepID=F6CW83_MARPP|nr:hypothetical protein [Marinomonas posidonica]AEF55444.1 hypothetical protein Mar181_2411 [Marinomonas posidonica IVIA-Po-181]